MNTVATANGVLLLFIPWITSQFQSENSPLSKAFPSPLFTSIAYGVLEPLYMRLFLGLGLPLWVGVLSISPLHSCMCIFAATALLMLSVEAIPPKPKPGTESANAGTTMMSLPKAQVYTLFALPLHTVAASNPALVFFAQSSNTPLLDARDTWRPVKMLWFVLLLYLDSRFADKTFSKGTWRAQNFAHSRTQLLYLLLMPLIKAVPRGILGLEVPLPLRSLDPVKAAELFAPEKSAWLVEQASKLPPAVLPVVYFPIMGLLALSIWMFRRSLRPWNNG